jgi:hypothetical protein
MNRLVIGPEQTALEHIKDASIRHMGGRARIAVAWAREDGVCWLLDTIKDRIPDLHFLVGINDRGTTVEALLRLLQHPSVVRVFFKHPAQTFHPKIYWFSDGAAGAGSATLIVGSSNITHGGLLSNFEASILLSVSAGTVSPGDRDLLVSVGAVWDSLVALPYAHLIEDANDIRKLYEAHYIVCEHTIRRARRRSGRTEQPLGDLPTSPPERSTATFPSISIPFPLGREVIGDTAAEDSDPPGSVPLPERFFVRTLTVNDVAKLRGRLGTFEPDLGETARDRYPAFWGWSDMYTEVTRRLSRREWQVTARLFSSQTPITGITIDIILWFREARIGHAAEHRFRPGPIGVVRQALPPSFDTSSLMVVEQAPSNADYQYVVRLITNADPGYREFSTYLTEQRPEHRFGYGP